MSVTPSRLRGWVRQDHRLTEANLLAQDSAEAGFGSYFTEAGRLPEIPVPVSRSELVLEAGGSMPDYDVDLAIQRGGYGLPDGATMRWKKGTDGSTSWRGWNIPKTLWGTQVPYSSAVTGYQDPDMACMPDGTIVTVCYRTGATDGVYAIIRSPAPSVAWSRVLIDSGSLNGSGYDRQQTICQRTFSDGSATELYCFYLVDTNTSENQIACKVSSDSGATWTLVSQGCLPTALTATYDLDYCRLRSAILNDQILLLVEVYNAAGVDCSNVVQQYASSDLGSRFTLISEWDGDAAGDGAGRYFDILTVNGQFQVYYLDPIVEAGRTTPAKRTITNAYEDLATVAADAVNEAGSAWGVDFASFTGTIATNDLIISEGNLAVCQLWDGTLLIYISKSTASYYHYILASFNFGSTWESLGQSSGMNSSIWYYGADTNSHPLKIKAVAQGGRVVMACNADSNPGTADNVLRYLIYGGWSTACLPAAEGIADTRQRYRGSWTGTWVPIDEPDQTSPDVTGGTGGDVITITTPWLAVDTDLGNTQRYYTYGPAHNSIGQGGMWVMRHAAGGSTTIPEIGMQLITDTGVDLWEIGVCVTATAVTVRDAVANATIGTVTIDTTAVIAIIAAIEPGTAGADDGKCIVKVIALGDTDQIPEDYGSWTTVTSSTLNSGVPGAGLDYIRWGHVSIATGNNDSDWFMRNYVQTAGMSQGICSGWTNPDDLFGCPIGYRGHVAGGLTVTGKGGPALVGQTWDVDRRHTYGVDAALPSTPMSRRWRNTADNLYQSLSWDLVAADNDDAYLEADSYGVALLACNVPQVLLQGWTEAGGAWATIATINTYTKLTGLTYVREHNTLRPATTSNPTTRYIWEQELVNATVDLGGGFLRNITKNTEGIWRGSSIATTKRPTIWFDGFTDTEPASGTMDIWARNTLAIVHMAAETKYKALRLKIPASQTVANYYTMKAVIGPFLCVPAEFSHDSTVDIRPQVTRTTHRDGTRSAVKQGRTTRQFRVQFADPIDMTAAYNQTAPPVLLNSSVQQAPLGAMAATPRLMTALLDDQAFLEDLVIYVRGADGGNATTDVYVTSDPEAFAVVRIQSGQEFSAMFGEEAQSQLVTGGEIEMIEELEP